MREHESTDSAGTQGKGFRHEALFYADREELLAGTVPFVRAGVEAGESVLVAMPEPSLRLLRGALDGEAERVQFVDMAELGRNPARIISAWRDFLGANLSGGRGMRGVGEPIWAGRSAPELEECERHESLLNLAFAGAPAWSLICPYDTANLSERVLGTAEHNHPVLSGSRARTTEYAHAADVRGLFEGRLRKPATVPDELAFAGPQLPEVRRFVAERGRRAGLAARRLEDLVTAASEVAANGVRHGGGHGTVEIWREDGAVVCDFRDSGRIEEPLAGRERPASTQPGGRGLWLANQLCDLVQIRWDAGGNLVRLQMALDEQPAAERLA